MNIFYLHEDPVICAEMHCDKHVIKMLIEYAQMMSTAHRILDHSVDHDERLYKATHINHPCNVWLRKSVDHYEWLYTLWENLNKEYKVRYKKSDHLSFSKLHKLIDFYPRNLLMNGWVDPPFCVAAHCRKATVVESYRDYYLSEKSSFATWKTKQPEWWVN